MQNRDKVEQEADKLQLLQQHKQDKLHRERGGGRAGAGARVASVSTCPWLEACQKCRPRLATACLPLMRGWATGHGS